MNNINDSYIEIHPTSRDDQLEKVGALFNRPLVSFRRPFIIIAGPPGSGKSLLMRRIIEIINNNSEVFLTIIILLNYDLQGQMISVFQEQRESSRKMTLIFDGNIIQQVSEAFRKGEYTVVFMNHLTPNNAKERKVFDSLVSTYTGKTLVLDDEIDAQLTSITGGMNAKLDHSDSILEQYEKVFFQRDNRLNILDSCRKYNAKFIGLSGTCNNLISSKIPSTGYSRDELCIINVKPIESQYKDLQIVKEDFDAENIDSLIPHLLEIERPENANKKGFGAFPCESKIKLFVKSYKKVLGRPMSYVSITYKNEKERQTKEWKEKLANAKYVLGINLVGTGFDIATHCKGQQFKLGILFRKLSDKTTNPLSKNPSHELHMEESSSFLQTVGRLRMGGVFIVHETSQITSYYRSLMNIYEIIRDGQNQCLWTGPPRNTQPERYYQCNLLGLLQNIREDEDRPVVQDILDNLKEYTDRDFKAECATEPSEFDADFWIDAIGKVWEGFLNEFNSRRVPKPRIIDVISRSDSSHSRPGTAKNGCAALALLSAQVVASAEQRVRRFNKRSAGETPLESRRENGHFPEIILSHQSEANSVTTRALTNHPYIESSNVDSRLDAHSRENTFTSKSSPAASSDNTEDKLQQLHEDNDEDIESETCSYESDFDENIPEIDFNMTTSGGGERDPRIIDIQVKEAVIARSNGDCGHCGRLFKPWEVPQICHIQRHDSNGRYTEDNLIYGHTSCDALYDEGRIIHDPEGGYWIDNMIPNHEPDKKQVSQINPAYILHRWNWEKSRQLFEDVSDDDFRQYLELEYTHRNL